jgi:trimethylamine--corrinoid protein Co-methyltransferase
LVPEQIIFDDEIYHTNRLLAEGIRTGGEALALDVIESVGPRGHFLAEPHTRRHLRDVWIPELTHPLTDLDDASVSDIRRRARAEFDRILKEHELEPLDGSEQKELDAILDAAKHEFAD